MAGPVVHTGAGLPDGPIHARFGYRYNYRNEDGGAWLHGDGGIHGSSTMEYYFGIHGSHGHPEAETEHFCYGLFPPLLNQEGIHRDWLHDFDFEAGGMALLGVTIGFSLGEFLDFLLGWFGLDIADDDTPSRRKCREYYQDRRGNPGPILPKKDGS